MKIKSLLIGGLLMMGTLCGSFASSLKTITFATEATYPPFETVAPSGQLQGFDIDVAKAICSTLKANCAFVNQPFDSLIPNLTLGKFDAIIAAMNITPDRQKVVNFTKAYYASTASFATPTNVNFDTTPGHMKGKIIGVQQGTTLAAYLQKTYATDVTVKTYASEETAFLDLASGRIDAVMGDTPLVKEWITEHGNGKYHIMGNPVQDESLFGVGYGIALNKDNAKLLKAMNQAITKLQRNGTLTKLEAKYFD